MKIELRFLKMNKKMDKHRHEKRFIVISLTQFSTNKLLLLILSSYTNTKYCYIAACGYISDLQRPHSHRINISGRSGQWNNKCCPPGCHFSCWQITRAVRENHVTFITVQYLVLYLIWVLWSCNYLAVSSSSLILGKETSICNSVSA